MGLESGLASGVSTRHLQVRGEPNRKWEAQSRGPRGGQGPLGLLGAFVSTGSCMIVHSEGDSGGGDGMDMASSSLGGVPWPGWVITENTSGRCVCHAERHRGCRLAESRLGAWYRSQGREAPHLWAPLTCPLSGQLQGGHTAQGCGRRGGGTGLHGRSTEPLCCSGGSRLLNSAPAAASGHFWILLSGRSWVGPVGGTTEEAGS